MDDYVAKPVRREDLDAVLGRWIPHPEQRTARAGRRRSRPPRRRPLRTGEPARAPGRRTTRQTGQDRHAVHRRRAAPAGVPQTGRRAERRARSRGDGPPAQRRLRLHGRSANGGDLHQTPGTSHLRRPITRPRTARRPRKGIRTSTHRPQSSYQLVSISAFQHFSVLLAGRCELIAPWTCSLGMILRITYGTALYARTLLFAGGRGVAGCPDPPAAPDRHLLPSFRRPSGSWLTPWSSLPSLSCSMGPS